MPHETIPFKPFLGITSGFLQTIMGSFGLPLADPPSIPLMVPVSDGDQLFCLDSHPSGWRSDQPIIILLHGLGGSSRSRYMVRLSRYLYSVGKRVIRVNLRGAGLGEGLARQPSHAGRSDDLLAVCTTLKNQFPDSDLKVIGFSLSGNIVLKMLGELAENGVSLVKKALAICPAIDLKDGATFIGKPENRFLEKYYVDCLLDIVDRKRKIYSDYPNIAFPDHLSIYEFDNLYTAPLSGYQNADEYYEKCSANRVVRKIQVPTTILYSLDDPVIPAYSITNLELPPNVTAFATRYGGHVGYLSWSGTDFWLRWLDKKVVELL